MSNIVYREGFCGLQTLVRAKISGRWLNFSPKSRVFICRYVSRWQSRREQELEVVVDRPSTVLPVSGVYFMMVQVEEYQFWAQCRYRDRSKNRRGQSLS